MYTLVVFVALIGAATAIPIDNGIVHNPEIECGSTHLGINFSTQNIFEGHVYVKGLYDKKAEGCRTTGNCSKCCDEFSCSRLIFRFC